jgi:hypothetical protein
MTDVKLKLAEFQLKLKVPKSQTNSFGKYKYRSCEDILEEVKKVINPSGYAITLTDEIINIGTHFYIKATAMLTNGVDNINSVAYAREAEEKKGMDAAQITGACSSYARKYALNGLFAIDDTKDPDTDEHTKQINKPEKQIKPETNEKEKPILLENTPEYDKVILYLNNSDETPYSEKILNIKSKFDISKVVKNFVKR